MSNLTPDYFTTHKEVKTKLSAARVFYTGPGTGNLYSQDRLDTIIAKLAADAKTLDQRSSVLLTATNVPNVPAVPKDYLKTDYKNSEYK